MIARLEGKLVKLDTESALVQVGAIGYEVMLPGYCISALAGRIGSNIMLCTMEYYEGSLGRRKSYPENRRIFKRWRKGIFQQVYQRQRHRNKKGIALAEHTDSQYRIGD